MCSTATPWCDGNKENTLWLDVFAFLLFLRVRFDFVGRLTARFDAHKVSFSWRLRPPNSWKMRVRLVERAALRQTPAPDWAIPTVQV